MSLLFGSRPCALPDVTAATLAEQGVAVDWLDRADTFRLSLGEAPGHGWVLLTKADLDALSLTADHTLTFVAEDGRQTPFQKITLIGSRCVSPGAPDDTERTFICELADRRFHLAKIPCNVAYNVRSAADGLLQNPTTQDLAGTAWTWAQIVDDLWTLLGAGSTPTLPFTPDGTPENLAYWGGWAWEAVCDVLTRIGCAVRYWPVTDTFTFVRLGVTDAAADAEVARLAREGLLTWNSDPTDPSRAWRPEKVRVRFPRRPIPNDGNTPWYTVDVTLAATTGVVSGSYVQLDDDSGALAATGAPSNAAALATRADERAADWLRKRQYADRPTLIVYRDFQRLASTLLSANIGTIIFDDRSGPRTQTQSAPDFSLEKWEPLSNVPKWWPPYEEGNSLWEARLTEATGAADWTQRYTNSAGTWGDAATTGADNAYPVELDGGSFAVKPTAKGLIWPDPVTAGYYNVLPIQSADLVSGTYYAGYVSTGNQAWAGNKTFRDSVRTNSGSEYDGTALTPGAYPAIGLDVGGQIFADAVYVGHTVVSSGAVSTSGAAWLNNQVFADPEGGGPTSSYTGLFAGLDNSLGYFFGALSAAVSHPGCWMGPLPSVGNDVTLSLPNLYVYVAGVYAGPCPTINFDVFDPVSNRQRNLQFTKGILSTHTLGSSMTVVTTVNGASGAVTAVTSVDVSGGTTGLTTSGGPITTTGTITLAGTLAIANGGTGQTTAANAINALLPSQGGNSGKFLTTNGTVASWGTAGAGTVTSVDGSGGSSGLTLTGGPITGSGTLTIGGTLSTGYGGTGAALSASGPGVVVQTSLGAVLSVANALSLSMGGTNRDKSGDGPGVTYQDSVGAKIDTIQSAAITDASGSLANAVSRINEILAALRACYLIAT